MRRLLISLALLISTGYSCAVGLSAAEVEAIAGQPFGVARLDLRIPPEDAGVLPGSSAYTISEAQGRVLYPAFSRGVLQRVLGADAASPPFLTVYFLFRGSEPFEVAVATPSLQTVRIVPRAERPRMFDRSLRRWFRQYRASMRQQGDASDYPPLVETYLASMLARRLQLNEPLLDRISGNLHSSGQQPSEGTKTLELLTGVERLHLETLRATSQGTGIETERATLPVPEEIPWRHPAATASNEESGVEPMAMHVPEECFYVRFGTFTNYLWMDNLLSDYGGDVGSMITARGHNANMTQRGQRRLGLKQSALAEIVGPQIVADVAFIGRDTYGAQGAAMGILFQAKSTTLLGIDLTAQRNEALEKEKENGATEETLEIAGHEISFMSTPDNAFRSFYAVDGDFHLVTTSRAIVERFLEAGRGRGALGDSEPFRYARSIMPLEREDTVFIYFSSAFFEGLLSPQYQVELERRLKATTDIELIKMARWAAALEGQPNETIDDLIRADVLPRGFGQRPDGSGPLFTEEGVIDSMRGAQGSFLPVPDVPFRAVTPAEQSRYAARAEYYRQNWQQMDPLMVAVKRYALDEVGRERITIDAHIAPLDDGKYRWLMSSLGEPTTSELVRPDDTLVLVQAAMRGGLLFPGVPAHTMFLGIQDNLPLTDHQPGGLLKTLQLVRSTPGFLGAWPKPGFLDLLPFGLGGQPDAQGFSQLLFGIWRWQGSGFSILSMDPGILGAASRQLGFRDTDDPAQIKVVVGDLSQALFADRLRSLNYKRARTVSVANVNFMHTLTQQLGVPREAAKNVAEDLLNAQLQCTLGGDYELRTVAGQPVWYSTGWPERADNIVPDDYRSPILQWFRGLNAGLTKYADRLIVRAHIDMQRKEREKSAGIPRFDFLRGTADTGE